MTPTLLHMVALTASPLWVVNHTSQVMSMATLSLPDGKGPALFAGSQYTSDQSVSSVDMQSGKLLWSSTALGQWTYGVALSPVHSGDGTRALATFGCPFDPEQAPVAPCELGFWKNATNGTLSWRMPIPGAEVSASHGPPFISFSAEGDHLLATFVDRNASDHPGAEFLAVVGVKGGSSAQISRALLGAGMGHGLHVLHPAATKVSSTIQALLSLPPPPPPPPPATPPWLPAADCNPACNASFSSCCNNPPSGQVSGICMGYPARPITNCSAVPHLHEAERAPYMGVARMDRRGLRHPNNIAATSAHGGVDGLALDAAYSLHYAVEVEGSVITVAETPSIDCNGTSACTWLASTPDLSYIVVDAKATVSTGGACEPFQWGIALMRRKGEAWPPSYETAWVKCGDKGKMLKSAHIDAKGDRILTTFANIQTVGQSVQVIGAEVCAFGTADARQLWCTPPYNVSVPPGTAADFVAALAEEGQLAFHVTHIGLLSVDAGIARQHSKGAPPPTIALTYDGSGNCCSATSVSVEGGVVVASIPDGSQSGIWCQCQHSKLIGIQFPRLEGRA